MSKSNSALNDCPFCGPDGLPFVVRIGNEHTKDRGADVGCRKCGFINRIRVIRYSCDWAEQRAIECWNTRAPVAQREISGDEDTALKALFYLRYSHGCWCTDRDPGAYGQHSTGCDYARAAWSASKPETQPAESVPGDGE